MRLWKIGTIAAAAAGIGALPALHAQDNPAPAMERVPDRQPGEGEGPFRRLVIRGATLIDGSGAPPRGPVDIVIAGNRIESIRGAGTPGLPIAPDREPRDFDREIDATGMYVLPGFVDVHGHNGDPDKAPNASYGYRLWLAHGVTTVRGISLYFGSDSAMALSNRQRSRDNSIVAPRLVAYFALGDGWSGGGVSTPERARPGCDGPPPRAMKASNCSTTCRPRRPRRRSGGAAAQDGHRRPSRAGRRRRGQCRPRRQMGLGGITHFYGHFESLLRDHRIPNYPVGYNMFDEQWRFSQVARLADQAVEPGSPEWRAYLERHWSAASSCRRPSTSIPPAAT